MGRSDKPVDPTVHEFEQHLTWMKALIAELGVANINLFVRAWSSLNGLRITGDICRTFSRA